MSVCVYYVCVVFFDFVESSRMPAVLQVVHQRQSIWSVPDQYGGESIPRGAQTTQATPQTQGDAPQGMAHQLRGLLPDQP